MDSGRRLTLLLLPGVLLVTWAGALALWWRFDGLYGQDPFAYFDYATGPARASLIRLGFLPSFYWPPGYPVLVAFASFVLGPIPLAGQLVSLLAGGATAVFTGLLAREVWQPNAGHASSVTCFLLAGLLVALNAQLVQSSVVVMSDATGLAAATLGVWALARYGRVGKAGWLWLASGALAWAIVTRWIYGLVAVPCAAYVLWVLLRRARACQKLLALRHGLGAALVSGLILLPVIIPALTSLVRSTGPAPFAVDLEVYRWNPLNAFQREFVTADGHLSYAWPNGLYYALAPAHIYYFTPLLALFIVLGVWAVWQRRSIEWWLLIVGWAAMVYAFHAGAAWQNFRFTLAYLPPLAVLAAAGLVEMQQRLRPRYAASLTYSLLLLGLTWMGISGAQLIHNFAARKQADLAIVRRVETGLPPEARLLAFGLTLTFQHYSHLETLELYRLSQSQLADLLAEGRPTFLLLDVDNVETQWRDQPLADNYSWLRDVVGLERIGQFGSYTFFEVNGNAEVP